MKLPKALTSMCHNPIPNLTFSSSDFFPALYKLSCRFQILLLPSFPISPVTYWPLLLISNQIVY